MFTSKYSGWFILFLVCTISSADAGAGFDSGTAVSTVSVDSTVLGVVDACDSWGYGRGPAQYINFFYKGSHLSELQSCTLFFSTKFYYIFIFK